MIKRIIFPTNDNSGLEANLAQHFGRAPYYTILDIDDNNRIVQVRTEVNKGEHAGGSGHPHQHLLALKPTIFVVNSMGPGCLSNLKNAGVNVLKTKGSTVKEIFLQFNEGKLGPLDSVCENSHHHEH